MRDVGSEAQLASGDPQRSDHPAECTQRRGGRDADRMTDEVADRRQRIKRLSDAGKRVGYLALLVAVVAFGVALATGLSAPAVTVTIVALVAACVVLPVPIVLGYGIRAAEREERARERGVG